MASYQNGERFLLHNQHLRRITARRGELSIWW
jgi:hypothetical protein